jgi:PleD family two-component response regulator
VPHTGIIPCSPIKTSALYGALVPAVNGKAPRNAHKAGAIDPDLARRHPLRILLVDDNAVNLSVGTKILERFGYTGIVTASDGQLALDACESTRFDLVLMDLAMPVSTRDISYPLDSTDFLSLAPT